MNERQKALLEKLGLDAQDFSKKENIVSDTERINDLEIAICELLDSLSATEEE